MPGLVPNYGQVVEGGPRDTIGVSVSGRPGELVQIPMGVPFEGRRVLVVQDGITASATLVVGDAPD